MTQRKVYGWSEIKMLNIYGKIDKSAKSNLLLFDNLRKKPQIEQLLKVKF